MSKAATQELYRLHLEPDRTNVMSEMVFIIKSLA